MLQAIRKLQSRSFPSDRELWNHVDSMALFMLFLLVSVTVLILSQLVLQDFPNSADEHAYLFQAQIFAAGTISVPAQPQQEFFSPFYIHTYQNTVFSIFPPGWPLLLSLGVRCGYPQIVNPVIAGLTVPALYFLSWLLFGRRNAWITVLLVILSPFFLFNSASYFSHPACFLGILLMTSGFVLWLRSEQVIFAVMAGFFFSGAFTIRELTASALSIVLFVSIFSQTKRKLIFILYFFMGAMPLLSWYLWYNAELSGSWFVPPRFLMPGERLGFGFREIRVFDYVREQYFGPSNALSNLMLNLGRLLIWTFPFTPILAAYGLIRKSNQKWFRTLASVLICLPAVYFFYPSDGGNQYGPRFYYESLGFLAMPAAEAILLLKEYGKNRAKRRLMKTIVLFILIIHVIVMAQITFDFAQQIYQRRTLFRLVERRNLHHAIVFVGASSGTMTQGDLIRNPPELSAANVLYAWDQGKKNRELMDRFPERSFYFFGYDRINGSHYITPIRPNPEK
ncbi:MAG: hypothetical protein C4527_14340 [Candidatus Omnitrophota bacterium]|jgi:hypothetical protein|nr:MAG: hypothetical protein C4527_14340 [Candidatus Omnitrophota bacterium]